MMQSQQNIAICPSAGMGHLAPFLRLASTLSSAPYNCHVTLVIVVPLLTTAESNEIASFFSSHPHIHRLDFRVDLASPNPDVDPFFLRYATLSRSSHHLASRLSSLSPPISASFSDFMFTKGFNTTTDLPYVNYTVITTSARFLSLMAYLPHLVLKPGRAVEIPGHDPISSDNIPPPFFHPDHVFTSLIISNAQCLCLSKGLLVNTFDFFESETISGFESGNVLPRIFPIGPLHAHEEYKRRDELITWLDEQPEKSVVYVSFGNRTALSRDQILEVGIGLERSGYAFIWVVKTSKIDKEEKDELSEILGNELEEKLSKKGKVVMSWVSQTEILGHKSVGGFISHCGWNSVTEAAMFGVPVVAWPQHGDQRENAGVVEKAGLGVWERKWGGGVVVESTEIAEKVEMVMKNEGLRKSAMSVEEEVKKACGDGGSSTKALMSIVESLKHA